jgi:hypothetical protein
MSSYCKKLLHGNNIRSHDFQMCKQCDLFITKPPKNAEFDISMFLRKKVFIEIKHPGGRTE